MHAVQGAEQRESGGFQARTEIARNFQQGTELMENAQAPCSQIVRDLREAQLQIVRARTVVSFGCALMNL
jgi:hypothetical protein